MQFEILLIRSNKYVFYMDRLVLILVGYILIQKKAHLTNL